MTKHKFFAMIITYINKNKKVNITTMSSTEFEEQITSKTLDTWTTPDQSRITNFLGGRALRRLVELEEVELEEV